MGFIMQDVGGAGTLPNHIQFTANGIYTPTSGMRYCEIEIWGAQGGGGGTSNSTATSFSVSGSGGGGGYVKVLCTSSQIGASRSIVIGTGGAGGAVGGGNGAVGGTSQMTGIASASGGAGGNGQNANSYSGAQQNTAGGAGGSFAVSLGTSLFSMVGETGQNSTMLGFGGAANTPGIIAQARRSGGCFGSPGSSYGGFMMVAPPTSASLAGVAGTGLGVHNFGGSLGQVGSTGASTGKIKITEYF